MKEGGIEKQNKIEEDGIEIIPDEGEAAFDVPEKKVKKLKEEIKDLKEKLREQRDVALRALADNQNLGKRNAKEREEWIKFSDLNFMKDLLPNLDSFDNAIKHLQENSDPESTETQETVILLYNQLLSILKSRGLKPIEAVGEKFNPEFHESIEVVEGEDSGVVVEEIQKGYSLHGKVIRPSKVKVGK
jgi:molecular chaperone GrpE